MSSYVIPVFPAASRVPPRDALAARLAELAGRFAELSSELAAINSAVASVSGKADKAPPAAAGNLASLDASGNLVDSGATPASIKAAAVAEVVANAPGTMDTLKEIADILGSSQQSGTVLKRISDLETGKASKSEMSVTAGSDATKKVVQLKNGLSQEVLVAHQDVSGKAEKSEMSVTAGPDATKKVVQLKNGLSQTVLVEHQDVSGKLDGAAAYPAWKNDTPYFQQIVSHNGRLWYCYDTASVGDEPGSGGGSAWTEITIQSLLAAKANSADVNAALALKASLADLPYRLVEPKYLSWGIIGLPSGLTAENVGGSPNNELGVTIKAGTTTVYENYWDNPGIRVDFSFTYNGETVNASAIPSADLFDRAVNAVPVSGPTTLTLPEKMDGKSRDFYVRLTVSAESAISFAATDSGGDTVAWDSMGDPSGTFAAGTYLYRFTEVADGVFHAADITSGGSIDPAVLDEKLDATSAAPAFDPTLTYIVGEYVTYGGILYRCKIAVTVAGAWTGDSNWVDVDMTSPDATLDIRSDGRLAVVAADSEILWIQGYDMAAASDVVLSCDRVNFYAFASGTTTQTFNMPSAPGGKVGDFVLDIDNSANASTAATATLNGFGTSFDVIVPKGQNLFTDILSFEGGEMCELYFTMTAFGTASKPAWKVVKQVVEKQEAGS